MIRNIIVLATALISIGSIILIYFLSKNEKVKKADHRQEHVIIFYPKYISRLAIWFMGFSVPFIFLAITEENIDWPVFAVLVLIFAFGAFLFLASKVWRIEVFRSKDYFIYRSFLGRKRMIYYSDCISYKFRLFLMDCVLKTNKKTYILELFALNMNVLFQMLRRHDVPEIRKEPGKIARFLLSKGIRNRDDNTGGRRR